MYRTYLTYMYTALVQFFLFPFSLLALRGVGVANLINFRHGVPLSWPL